MLYCLKSGFIHELEEAMRRHDIRNIPDCNPSRLDGSEEGRQCSGVIGVNQQPAIAAFEEKCVCIAIP